MLVTSRQSLGVSGESLVRRGPLASPELNSDVFQTLNVIASTDALAVPLQEQFPALHLFLQRALGNGVFELMQSNAAAVVRICTRLEGNALALELAAVQTRIYAIEDLDRQLDDIFATLVTNNPTVPPRQRTLKALLSWSFDHLPESEMSLMARLSVFRGSWTLAAVTEICGGAGIDRKSVPTLVSTLADKCLIETIGSGSGSMRFKLLEMVRVFASDSLDEHGDGGGMEPKRVVDSYLAFYLEFAMRLKRQLTTNDQPSALDEMERERENMRTALEYGIKDGNAVLALKLANSMWRYWMVRGYYSEGLTWFNRALELRPAPELELLCESYVHAGNIANSALRLSEARGYYERYLELETERGDPIFVAAAQASLALVLHCEGAFNQALELLSTSVDVLKRNGKGFLAAVCASNMGNNYVGLGDYKRAIHLYREALGIFQNFSETTDFTHAMVSYSAALAINSDMTEAIATLNEIMPRVFSLGSVNDLPRALLVYLCVAVQREAFEDAARLLGLYTAYNDSRRLMPSILQRVSHERDLAATRSALGPRFQSHFDQGYELPYDSIEPYLRTAFD